MPSSLLDTSVYISHFRRGGDAALVSGGEDHDSSLWLSSVVLEELYAGANEKNRQIVEQLERDFDRIGRILVPNLGDWTQAGRVLSRLAAKYDYETIGRARLTNDALIAISAGRGNIAVITTNGRDFRRLAEFCPFQWRQIQG